MITGIENIKDARLQKAVLEFIANTVDLTEDIEIEFDGENTLEINGSNVYAITDNEQKKKIARYNRDRFEAYFDDLSNEQLAYVDEDQWIEDYGIESFTEYLEEDIGWTVDDSNYYGSYNFYEVH